MIRVEFNQTLCEYYTELDAVILYGIPGGTGFLETAVDESLRYLEKLTIKDEREVKKPFLAKGISTQASVDEKECSGYFNILPVSVLT